MSIDQSGRPVYHDWNFGLPINMKPKLRNPPENDQIKFKAGVLRVSPCVVAVVTLGLPPEMTMYDPLGSKEDSLTPDRVFIGQGTIIECDKNANDDKYSATILTSACLFIRTNGVKPEDIEVEVYLAERVKCKGKVFACDFHYNLAIVTIQMDTPVRPAKLRDLDDIMSIHVTDEDQSRPFQLRRHSTSFKILPGDKVASLARSTKSDFYATFGQFSPSNTGLDCKELYSITTDDPEFQDVCGCPIINFRGEVIGIFAAAMTFLPSNIVSRWWNCYKKFRKYCRPWLGLTVANLHSANLSFLDSFVCNFPDVSSGIVVLQVEENSAAYTSGLCREDVIVQCNGDIVGSTLDLFDKIYDKVGESVTLSFLRKAGGQMNVKVIVDEAGTNKYYRWPVRPWMSRPGDNDSDSEPGSPVYPPMQSLESLESLLRSFSDSDQEMPESPHPT